jgi:hypothetical protein
MDPCGLLDPNPDFGSTDPTESGSGTKHWFLHIHTLKPFYTLSAVLLWPFQFVNYVYTVTGLFKKERFGSGQSTETNPHY